MGLLSSLLPIAGSVVGNMIAPGIGGQIGGMLGGAIGGSGSSSAGNLTTTSQNKMDPRADNMLWGSDGKSGLLSQYQGYLNQPQSAALQGYGKAAGDYLNNYGAGNMQQIQGAATNAMTGTGAALASLPAYAVGNQIQAPNQNNIDLTSSYQNLLSGGDQTALNNAMNSAVNATNAGFKTNQDNVTNSLMRTVLPSIRSNSVLAGQYGGSRQGIAEGNAISDYTNQLTNANSQLAATNSANTTAQAANAYQQGQDRALAATQGLGAQQYNVAGQNAATKNAAEFMNVGNSFDASKFNASTTNAMDAQNKSSALAGAGLLGNLSNNAYNVANNADNYQINRAQQVNGLLSPYLGMNQSQTNSQPLYQNQAGNALGGALLGGQLAGMFGGGSGGTSVFNTSPSVGDMTSAISGQQLPINTSGFGSYFGLG